MKHYISKVNEIQAGLRIDVFLSQVLDNISRNKIQHLIKNGLVSLQQGNNFITITDCNYKVSHDEEYQVIIPESTNTDIADYNIQLDLLYEDEHLLVINKPAGLVVHPGAGNTKNTLVNALVAKYRSSLSSIGGEERPGIVHRLDKETSGVIVIAKTDFIHSKLSEQFSTHSIQRNYRALLWGVPQPLQGTIDNIIGRSRSNRQKMAVLNQNTYYRQRFTLHGAYSEVLNQVPEEVQMRGKRAVTIYKTLKISDNKLFTLVDCSLQTGRTHQIRVHFSNLGHPVVGDKVYGKQLSKEAKKLLNPEIVNLSRHALHAYRLEFTHPATNQIMNFEAPEDEELLNLYKILFNNWTLESERSLYFST